MVDLLIVMPRDLAAHSNLIRDEDKPKVGGGRSVPDDEVPQESAVEGSAMDQHPAGPKPEEPGGPGSDG